MLPPVEEMTPKRQAVVDRLKRRLDAYRKRQKDTLPRCDQSFSLACEQQNMETSALQKRFLEGKAKRVAKKGPAERKPDLPPMHTINNLHSSVHVQQKFGCGDYEPPPKMQCGGGGGGGGVGNGGLRGEGLTKFSVEIVQQLEFTTSAADSHPQQISTNVTVKALTNAAVKSDSSPPPPPRPASPVDCKRECKSEVPDDDFVDLDECAAALERDAFPGLADLIGEEDGGDFTSAAIEDLITEISEYPEFMKNFDLNGGGGGGLEAESGHGNKFGYGGPELSPAAQTLKQMAEQHQQAAAAEWGARYRPYGPYRPRAPHPHPQHEHIHLSQAQQLHVSQPHHNLQVSAGQHMQVNGSLASRGAASAQQQQGVYASTAQPAHEYSLSQSQSVSLGRQRPPQQQQQQHHPNYLGTVVAAGLSHELQAKMMQQQQQQMLRQQQLRPPPPEYKPPPGATAAAPRYASAPGRRAAAPGLGAPPRSAYQQNARPAGPNYQDWRHPMQAGMRHPFAHHHQGGFNMGGMGNGGTNASGLTMQQQQLQQQMQQQARLQQHQMLQQQHRQNQQNSMSHLVMQQNQGMNVHGQMSNIHMSQSQSISLQQQGVSLSNGGPFPQLQPPAAFPSAPPDFSLDFLDSIPSGDNNSLTAQELINSLDNSLFNDII